MFQMKGKYAYAIVYIDSIDETTMGQIQQMLDHPAFANLKIRIMPDAHAGAGCVIGFTCAVGDFIIPNIVGVDINCGVYSWNLGQIEIDYAAFDKFIRANMPSGTSVHSRPVADLPIDVANTCKKIGIDSGRVQKAIGTLGGGNHFLEIGVDPEGNKWLTVHSGSRNFGKCVADYHQKKAKALMNKMLITTPKDMEYLPMDMGGSEYIEDMLIASEYAKLNRLNIANEIMFHYFDLSPIDNIFTNHNYIDMEEGMIRKGAVSAKKGERLLIPFNMRDGIAVCEGKGHSNWNSSAPHGAGRIYSRSKAKEEIPLELFEESMKGIFTTCVSAATLDESPFAYKEMDTILEAIKETVDVQFMIKPEYNYKAS